jgi:hypothetical protein
MALKFARITNHEIFTPALAHRAELCQEHLHPTYFVVKIIVTMTCHDIVKPQGS